MKKGLLLLFLAVPVLAEGPRFRHKDPPTNLEFQNVYQDIREVRSSTAQINSIITTTNTWTANQNFTGSTTTVVNLTINGQISPSGVAPSSGSVLISQGQGIPPKWTGAGRILQIVTSTMTSIPQRTTTSASYSSSSLNVNITPLVSNSKIIVLATQSYGASNAASTICTVRVQRDTTDIQKPGDPVALTNDSATEMDVSLTLFAVDSPGDTNQHTYRTTFSRASGAGTCVANPTAAGGNGGAMMLVEIAPTQ